jgi:ammonium transporter, Amt family
LLFLTAWLIFVYFPFVHMVWSPEGLFSRLGVLDFAGGIVVHTTAGFAALASVIFIGRRRDSTDARHNVPLMALGAGLLWFGWFGFNAGSEVGVDWVTVSSFVNTQLGAAFAGFTWLVLEWANVRRPNFVGLMTGAVAGLAAITPAAGYVSFGTAPAKEYLLRVAGSHTVRQVSCRAALGSFFGSALPSLHPRPGRSPPPMRRYGWLTGVTSIRVDAETEKLGLDARLLGEAAYSEDQ